MFSVFFVFFCSDLFSYFCSDLFSYFCSFFVFSLFCGVFLLQIVLAPDHLTRVCSKFVFIALDQRPNFEYGIR